MSTEGFDDALGASYRLLERLGRGATGEVWRALDRRTDEVVAAKLLRQEHTSDQDLVGRFVRERSILTGLRHPHVVAVRDLVVEGDRLAIVMDLVDGGSLREVLREGPLPAGRAAAVVAAVLEALGAAHARGILHRDVKPDNVLLTSAWQDLDAGAVRLTDFGISRMVAEGAGTTTGLMGTPEYMAPELLVTGTCDLSADVYGTGILLYELLAGRTPFAGPGTDYTVAHRHVASVPPPLDVPAPLARVLDAMLAKDPTARPGASEAAATLRRLVPELAGVAALAAQAAPADFDSARGPMTMLRGITPEPAPTTGPRPTDGEEGEVDGDDGDDGVRVSSQDLGTPEHGTMLRPMSVPSTAREAARRDTDRATGRHGRPKPPPRWRDPRVLGVVAAAVVLLGGAVAYTFAAGEDPGPDQPAAPTGDLPPATTQDETTAAGLTVERSAEYDSASGTVVLTLTYSAQGAPLQGPFLQVIPETDGGDCPTVTWDGGDQAQDDRTGGLGVDCGWSVDPGPVEQQGSVEVTASVPLVFDGDDPGTELQAWLDDATQRTAEAVDDDQYTSTAYPVQRLDGVQVETPQTILGGRPLPVRLLPVWPNGPDALNPLFNSETIESPTTVLTAIAGGYEGVRFTPNCSNLVISGGGLNLTTGGQTPECTVTADVGIITETSNPFAISGRDS